MIFSAQHQEEITRILEWRQQTSMPIVRVKSFIMGPGTKYPKNCIIKPETPIKPFKKIKALELPATLYLLR